MPALWEGHVGAVGPQTPYCWDLGTLGNQCQEKQGGRLMSGVSWGPPNQG